MDNNIIKYGIGEEYVPDWGISEAIREIYQNFIDYGAYDVEYNDIDGGLVEVEISNDCKVDNLEILKIGTSIKSSGSIGQHGEGLKLAMMIFLREDYHIVVHVGGKRITPMWVDDDIIGTVFALKVEDSINCGFKVGFNCPENDFIGFKDSQLTDEDIKYHSYYGDILNKPQGDIYVGGLYVCNLAGYNYAYNFKPDDVALERDRTIPCTGNVEYYASRIMEDYSGTDVVDLISEDCKRIDYFPKHIEEKVEPRLENGEIKYDIEDITLPMRYHNVALKSKIIREKVSKLRYQATRKRKPHSFIKDFYDKHYESLYVEAKVDFNVILKKSKEWEGK